MFAIVLARSEFSPRDLGKRREFLACLVQISLGIILCYHIEAKGNLR